MSFPVDKFATAVSMEKNSSISMSVLLFGKLLFQEKLPTKKQLIVQMTWQEVKSEGFRESLRFLIFNRL